MLADCHTLEQALSTQLQYERIPIVAPLIRKPSTQIPVEDEGKAEPTLMPVQVPFQEYKIESRARRFKVLQQMRATVLDIKERTLVLKLADLTNRRNRDEIAELPTRRIPIDDREMIDFGSVIYWSFGTELIGDNEKPFSEFRVLRSPDWSLEEVEQIKARGSARYLALFGEDVNVPPAAE